jgi:BACON domain-containing protein
MKPNVKSSTRNVIAAVCVLFASACLFAPSISLQQQGGAFTLHPTLIPGGGGASANRNTSIAGSSGQGVSGSSSGGAFSLGAGFWPNAVPCPFSVSPHAQFFTTAGGAGSINVIAPGFCAWSATVKADWIIITSSDSGAGNDTITFETRENFTGVPRQASITVSGLNQVVVQDAGLGDDCNYVISPQFQSFSATGGSGVVNVIAEERCAWQAVATDSWITITSLGVGIGNGAVAFSVATNASTPGRNAAIVIAGKIFAVKQKGR